MRGIAYVRFLLKDSTEAFAEKLGVSRSTVFKWETGVHSIPKIKKENISAIFNCPAEYLDRDVTQDEQQEIAACLNEYLVQEAEDEQMEFEPDENSLELYLEKVEAITDLLQTDPDVLEDVQRLLNILQKPNGRKAINLLLAAGEKYVGIRSSKMLAIGKTNHITGRIHASDNSLAIITNTLDLTFREKEPGKQLTTTDPEK